MAGEERGSGPRAPQGPQSQGPLEPQPRKPQAPQPQPQPPSHRGQVLLMTLGELAFLVPGIPLYIFLVLPNHPAGALPGLVPVIGAGVNPALAVLAAVATVAAGLGIVFLMSRLLEPRHYMVDEMRILVNEFTVADFVPIYLAAGIGEEFLFRVALVEPLGIVVPALLFTAVHIAYWRKPAILAYVFVFGLLAGALYVYTESFLLCALAHAAYNFLVSCFMKWGIVPIGS